MVKIYKYPIWDTCILEEKFYMILDIQMQGDNFVVWVVTNEDAPNQKMLFRIIGTGWAFDVFEVGDYRKTLQDNEGLVWHIFTREI